MMKTIKIHKDTRLRLRMIRNQYETVDSTVNRLLDIVESDLNDKTGDLYGFTNIKLSDETINRIRSLAVNDKEPFDSVLRRAIGLYIGSDLCNIVEDE